ncbi:hypothetical protein Taro_007165 [Colocasia esculenta]|uniref:Uncharacterized protein n=1 Tax=Colocasia esculenta TaxID=4460 RepID=A0A843TUP7_COLES|nr:hypothetical protein [Colocasia esculenta]
MVRGARSGSSSGRSSRGRGLFQASASDPSSIPPLVAAAAGPSSVPPPIAVGSGEFTPPHPRVLGSGQSTCHVPRITQRILFRIIRVDISRREQSANKPLASTH